MINFLLTTDREYLTSLKARVAEKKIQKEKPSSSLLLPMNAEIGKSSKESFFCHIIE